MQTHLISNWLESRLARRGTTDARCSGMRRIIFTVLALSLVGGVASADRGHRRGRHHHSGGVVVRDQRHREPVRVERRDRGRDTRRARVERRPVYVNNGRFVFHGGITRTYSRPVIQYRYRDYNYRPAIIAETYDPVAGYIWVQGRWSWTGYEWSWVGGYYAPDPSYQDQYYYDSY
jgi:hypothetical protein